MAARTSTTIVRNKPHSGSPSSAVVYCVTMAPMLYVFAVRIERERPLELSLRAGRVPRLERRRRQRGVRLREMLVESHRLAGELERLTRKIREAARRLI